VVEFIFGEVASPAKIAGSQYRYAKPLRAIDIVIYLGFTFGGCFTCKDRRFAMQ
jgi:hypothetical protein